MSLLILWTFKVDWSYCVKCKRNFMSFMSCILRSRGVTHFRCGGKYYEFLMHAYCWVHHWKYFEKQLRFVKLRYGHRMTHRDTLQYRAELDHIISSLQYNMLFKNFDNYTTRLVKSWVKMLISYYWLHCQRLCVTEKPSVVLKTCRKSASRGMRVCSESWASVSRTPSSSSRPRPA